VKPGPLTPTETRDRLRALEHRANKTLGQNFLIDGNIVRKSVELAGLQADEIAVEIGPGLGTLTRLLLDHAGEVYAIEKDPVLSEELNQNLKPQVGDLLHLKTGDAVEDPLAGLPEEKALEKDFSIVANLPYAITTPWLERVLRGPLPRKMVLMMQKEAGERLRAEPGSKHFGAITIFLSAAYDVTGEFKVSRNCFYPVPGVDSLLLRLERKAQPGRFPPAIREAVREVFTRRRKQIGTAARGVTTLEAWIQALPDCSRRPEEIALEDWYKLIG